MLQLSTGHVVVLRILIIATITLSACSASWTIAAATDLYAVTEVGSIDTSGADRFDALLNVAPSDVNNQGVVLANAFPDGSAFESLPLTDSDGSMVALGDGLRFGSGAQINDRGEVVGYVAALDDTSLDHVQAVVWRDGMMVELPEFDVDQSQAFGINTAGVIVGNASLNSPEGVLRHAVRWNDDQITDLGTLGGPGSNAASINDPGTIVGYSMVADRTGTFPTLWESDLPRELPTPDGRNGGAVGINDDGTVIGVLVDADTNYYPIRWINGEPDYLPLISNKGEGAANGINASGQIVGWTKRVKSDAGIQVAVLWNGDEVIDLNKRIPAGSDFHLTSAMAINDAGQIAVEAVGGDGHRHALLLTPIESSAMKIVNGQLTQFAADLRRTR